MWLDWETNMTERRVEIPAFFDLIREHDPKTMLDVGFGGGWYHKDIVARGIKYTGMDAVQSRITGQSMCVSEERKREWIASLNRIEVICSDIVDWRSQRRFDMVACISVIEHIIPCGYGMPDRGDDADMKAVEKMMTHVKPGGHFVLSFPTGVDKTGKPLGPDDLSLIDATKFGQIIEYGEDNVCSFWIEENPGKWLPVTESVALDYEYKDFDHARTLCILCMRPKSII